MASKTLDTDKCELIELPEDYSPERLDSLISDLITLKQTMGDDLYYCIDLDWSGCYYPGETPVPYLAIGKIEKL